MFEERVPLKEFRLEFKLMRCSYLQLDTQTVVSERNNKVPRQPLYVTTNSAVSQTAFMQVVSVNILPSTFGTLDINSCNEPSPSP
jgi:hypothetical protein